MNVFPQNYMFVFFTHSMVGSFNVGQTRRRLDFAKIDVRVQVILKAPTDIEKQETASMFSIVDNFQDSISLLVIHFTQINGGNPDMD